MTFLQRLFGSAEAEPSTLDQARAKLTTIKTNAEKIGRLIDSASLDLDGLLGKGDGALKDHIDGLVASARSAAETEAAAKLAAEAAKLTAKSAELAAGTAKITAFADALAAAGIDRDPAKIKESLDMLVAKKARETLVASGHSPIDGAPAEDAGTAKAKTKTHAEFSALSAGAKMAFCKSGGKILDLPNPSLLR